MLIQCIVCDHCRTMIPLITGEEKFIRTNICVSSKQHYEPKNNREFSFCNKDCFVEFTKAHLSSDGQWDKEASPDPLKASTPIDFGQITIPGVFQFPNQQINPGVSPWRTAGTSATKPYQVATGDSVWVDDSTVQKILEIGSTSIWGTTSKYDNL
jgi:hypothetical protein